MPPRHGKSSLCSHYFPAWYLGTYPDKRILLTSYEAAFAASWGRKARNVLEEYGGEFGVAVAGDSHAANSWSISGHDGSMVTAGAGGSLTGRGADVLICDDPVKNWEEAQSETIRNNVWDWWTSTAYTRLEPDAAVVVIQTRWHEDDLAGRLLAEAKQGGEQWRVINLPAIAEDNDPTGRQPGEALWPARYNVESLKRIEQAVGPQVWSSLYQQRPAPPEGGQFKRDWFEIVPQAPRQGWLRLVRAWDFGYTNDAGDYCAAPLLGVRKPAANQPEELWILDMVRGQWASWRRDDCMALTAAQDEGDYAGKVCIWFPEDPAAGKDVADRIKVLLRGYRVDCERMTRSKEARADAFRSFCGAEARRGCKVKVLQGLWNKAMLDELAVFPNGKHDDQVDGLSLGFGKVIKPHKVFAFGNA